MFSIFESIRRFLGLTTMKEDTKWFFKQYEIVKIIIYKYLSLWFKQIFDMPEFKNMGFSEDFYQTMSARVTHYLLGGDKDSIEGIKDKKIIEEIKLANKHVEKWADDVLDKDKDLCELVVQTLRMYSIFKSYLYEIEGVDNGNQKFLKSKEGERITYILLKHGNKIPTSPNPRRYSILISKWYLWLNFIKKRGIT
jgi:hypothetical protein